MTVTNNERREVAKRLRELPTDMYEVEELWETKGLDTCCKDQTDYYLIHFALFECFPEDHMHPCDYEELHMRLADLIEPEPERTCRMRDAHWDDGRRTWGCICSECRSKHEHKSGKWMNYCPSCGAKVVDV